MKLCDFCIKRPAFTVVLSLLLIAIGLLCFFKLPLRYVPKIAVPVVTISTDYPGASSQIVETQVTNILEGAMSGIDGLKNITSSSTNGNSQITLTFRVGTSLNAAAADVRANVSQVLDQLPSDIKTPVVSKTNPNAQPILFLAYFNPNESIGQLTNYVKQFIVPRYEASPGVAKVMLWSPYHYALRIWLNPTEMAARGVTANDIKSVLRAQNTAVPTGTIKGKQVALTVVTDLKLSRPKQFANIVIKDTQNHVVKLGDVAKVQVGSEYRTSATDVRYFTVDGKAGVAIGLTPEAGANALAMTDQALALSERIKLSLPHGMRQIVEYNQSSFTRVAINSVYEAIVEAFVLILIVISLFLGSFRSAMVPIITVPICLIASFTVVYLIGYTVNSITLLALVLAVGLVVDDAIIMLENISRHIEQGDKPLEAAFKGSREIAFAVLAMTITLVGVYVPVAFLEGVSGVFFKEFAFTLLGAVFISGFVALTLSPMMCGKILKAQPVQSAYQSLLAKKLSHLEQGYKHLLSWVLRHIKSALCILLVLICVGGFVFVKLPKELAPQMAMPLFNMWVKVAPQTSYQKIHSQIGQFEKVLNNTPQIDNYLMQNWELGDFYAVIALKSASVKNAYRIASDLQAKLANIPGTNVNVSVVPPPLMWFLPSANPGEIEMNVLSTASFESIGKTLQTLMAKVKKDKRFENTDISLRWNARQLNIHVNRLLAADLNVPLNHITDTLQTMLGGVEVGKYTFGNQNFDVIMQLPDSDLNSADVLNALYVHSDKQKMIPLNSLLTTYLQNSPAVLEHTDRLRSGMLTTKLAPGVSMSEGIRALQQLAHDNLPSNTTYRFAGAAAQYLESSSTMLWVFVFSLIFIYLILVAQFESFVDPFIILTCVPFALIGALLMLKLTGNSLNLYSEIGLITLVGLIAKHGILITDFANKALAQGYTKWDAVIRGAALRLRPILMTTAAMVFGALPLALAFGPGSENRQQIGWVIVGGLLFGTFISLFLVPVAYILIKKSRQ